MRRQAAMSYEDFALFLVNNVPEPTEGLILDALRREGASEEEADAALERVRSLLEDVEIDVPDDVDVALEEAEEEFPEEEFDPSMAESIPVDVPGDLSEGGRPLPSDVPSEEGLEDERPMHEEDSVELTGDELFETVNDYLDSQPDATVDDLKRYLLDLGIPGDKVDNFVDKGLSLLKASRFVTELIFTSNVTWMAAARALQENNPNITSEDIRNALREAGAADMEIEEVIQQLPAPQQMEGLEEQNPWEARVQEYLATDPNMKPEEIMEKLQGEGASPEEAQAAVDAALSRDSGLDEPETFNPEMGQPVQTPRGAARIAAVYETLDGNVYEARLEDGSTAYFGIDALSTYKEEKTSSNNIFEKIASHLKENWYTDSQKLPRSHKKGYEERLAKTEALVKEIREAIKTAAPDEQQELMKVDLALEHEAQYCRDKIAKAFTLDDAEYLGSQPKFKVNVAHTANEMGPSYGSIALAAQEAEEEAANYDWKREVTAGAELFVDEVDPILLGSSGDVRRMASRYIEAKTAALESEQKNSIISTFVSNVEKARRKAVRDLKLARANQKEASIDLPDGAQDEGVFF